jgi:hypothetical protein
MDKKETSSSFEKEKEKEKETTAKKEEAAALEMAEKAEKAEEPEQMKAATEQDMEDRPSERDIDTSGDDPKIGGQAANIAPDVWKTPELTKTQLLKVVPNVFVSVKGDFIRYTISSGIIKTYSSRIDFEFAVFVEAAKQAAMRMYAMGNMPTSENLVGYFTQVVDDPSPWANADVGTKLKEYVPLFRQVNLDEPEPGQFRYALQRPATTYHDQWLARRDDPRRAVVKVQTPPDDPIKIYNFTSFGAVYPWQSYAWGVNQVRKFIMKPQELADALNDGWQLEHFMVNGGISEDNIPHPYYVVAPPARAYSVMHDVMKSSSRTRKLIFLKQAMQLGTMYNMVSNDSTKIANTLKQNMSDNLTLQTQSTYVPQFLGATAASKMFAMLISACTSHQFVRWTASFRGRSLDPTALLGALSYITFVPAIARDRRSQLDACNCIFQFLSIYSYTYADVRNADYRVYNDGSVPDANAPLFTADTPQPPNRSTAKFNCNLGYPDFATFMASVSLEVLNSSPLWRIFLNAVAPGSHFGTMVEGNGARGAKKLFEYNPADDNYAPSLYRFMDFLEAISSMRPNQAATRVRSQISGYSDMLRAPALTENFIEYFYRVGHASGVLSSVSLVPTDINFEPDDYTITEPLAILGMVLGIDYSKCYVRPSYYNQRIQHNAEIYDLCIVDGLGQIVFTPGALPVPSNKKRVEVWDKMVAPFEHMFMSEWVSANWQLLTRDWRPSRTTDDRYESNTGIVESPKALTKLWISWLSAGSELAKREGVIERAIWSTSDSVARMPDFRNDTSAIVEQGVYEGVETTQFEGKEKLPTYNSLGVRRAGEHNGLPSGGLPAPTGSAAIVQYDYTGDQSMANPPYEVLPTVTPAVPWLRVALRDNSSGTTIQESVPELISALQSVLDQDAPVVQFTYSWSDSTTVFNDYTGQLAVLRPFAEDIETYFPKLTPEVFVQGVDLQFYTISEAGKQRSLKILTISTPPV